MSELVGLEVLYSTLALGNKCDALVAAVHWILVLNELRCVGLDVDQSDASGQDTVPKVPRPSELLPTGWNDKSADVYGLKYVQRDRVTGPGFLVKMVFADGILIVNVLRSEDNKTASLCLPVNNFIGENISPFHSVFRNVDQLKKQFGKEVTQPLGINRTDVTGTERKANTRLPEHSSDNSSTYEERFGAATAPSFRPVPLGSSFPDDESRLPPVGHGDLHPTGRGQGGMLMDPRDLARPLQQRPPENLPLPRGAVPPGARFDPFGPPVPGQDQRRHPRFGGPDPDHLPPPGYDDMFL